MLLDSVIVIDYLNGVPGARVFVERTPDLVLSVITVAEVMAGADPEDPSAIAAYLDTFPVLSIDSSVARRAGRLRQTERWKLPDAFQAALAQHHGLKLVTRNTRDFVAERHDFVLVPYRRCWRIAERPTRGSSGAVRGWRQRRGTGQIGASSEFANSVLIRCRHRKDRP